MSPTSSPRRLYSVIPLAFWATCVLATCPAPDPEVCRESAEFCDNTQVFIIELGFQEPAEELGLDLLRGLEQTGAAFEYTDFAISHAGCAVPTSPPTKNYDFEECFAAAVAASEVGLRDEGRRVVVFLADDRDDLPMLPTAGQSELHAVLSQDAVEDATGSAPSNTAASATQASITVNSDGDMSSLIVALSVTGLDPDIGETVTEVVLFGVADGLANIGETGDHEITINVENFGSVLSFAQLLPNVDPADFSKIIDQMEAGQWQMVVTTNRDTRASGGLLRGRLLPTYSVASLLDRGVEVVTVFTSEIEDADSRVSAFLQMAEDAALDKKAAMAYAPRYEHDAALARVMGVRDAAFVSASAVAAKYALGVNSMACSLFGMHTNVVTFDGVPWSFTAQGAGEFWMAKSDTKDADVQVRLEACDPASVGLQSTCATAVAIRTLIGGKRETIELNYMRSGSTGVDTRVSSDRFMLRIGGDYQNPIQPEYFDVASEDADEPDFAMRVEERVDDGWNVYLRSDSALYQVQFTWDGPMIWILPDAEFRARTEGLCGNFNGCGADEVNNTDGDAQQAFGEYYRVSERDSLFTHRRNQRYPANPQFHPLVTSFDASCETGAAWLNNDCLPRLAAGLGTHEQLNVFFEACELYCQTGVSFFGNLSLDDACGQVCDVRSERIVLPDVNEPLETAHVATQLFLEDDDVGPAAIFSPVSNIGGKYMLRYTATSTCATTSRDVELNFVCGTPYTANAGEDFEVPMTPIGYGEIEMHASDGDLSAAALDDVRDVTLYWTFSHLPLTLVDQYRSRSRGYPVNGAGEFTREDAGYFLYDRRPPQGDIPVFTRGNFATVLLEHFVRFELREIFFEAGITEDVDMIEDVEDVEALAAQLFDVLVPQVRGNRSPNARWSPSSPGVYTLVFAAMDGCRFDTDSVEVNVRCPECTPRAHIVVHGDQVDASSRLGVNLAGTQIPSINWLGTSYDEYDLSSVVSEREIAGLTGKVEGVRWRLEAVADETRETRIMMETDDLITLAILSDTEYGVSESDSGAHTKEPEAPVVGTSAFWNDGSGPFGPETINAADASEIDVEGYVAPFSAPPFEYAHVYRQEFYRVVEQSVVEWNYTTVPVRERDIECKIELAGSDMTFDDKEVTFAINREGTIMEDNAKLCEGTYRIEMEAWGICARTNDVIDMEVTCGAEPVAIINCIPYVEYDYELGNPGRDSFPVPISLSAQMSYSGSFSPDLEYLWEVVESPAEPPNRGALQSAQISDPQSVSPSLTLPNRGGEYTIALTVSDGCQQHTTRRVIEARCETPAPQLAPPMSGQTITYMGDRTDASQTATVSSPQSTWARQDDPDFPITDPFYGVTISGVPDLFPTTTATDYEERLVRASQAYANAVNTANLLNPDAELAVDAFGRSATFLPPYPGNWMLKAILDDGCAVATQTVQITKRCARAYTLSTTTNRNYPYQSRTFPIDDPAGRVYVDVHFTASSNAGNYPDEVHDYEFSFVSVPTGSNVESTGLNGDILAAGSTPSNPHDPVNPNGSGNQYVLPANLADSEAFTRPAFQCGSAQCFSFKPDTVGTYVVAMTFYDGCKFRSTIDRERSPASRRHIEIVVTECQTSFASPRIASESSNSYDIEVGGSPPNIEDQIVLSADAIDDTYEPFRVYEWTVVQAPEGSECFTSNGCSDVFISVTSNRDVRFFPDAPGQWRFRITASIDGSPCAPTFAEQLVTVTQSCPFGQPSASILRSSPANSVLWSIEDTQFPLVTVFATQVTIPQGLPDDLSFEEEIDYYWTIINAPESSTYYPHCYSGFNSREEPGTACSAQVMEVEPTQVFTLNEGDVVPPQVASEIGDELDDFVVPGDSQTTLNVWSSTTTTTEWQSYVQLAPLFEEFEFAEDSAYERLTSCFLPDVPGRYELQLRMHTQCHGDIVAPQTVVFNAQCRILTGTTVPGNLVSQKVDTSQDDISNQRFTLDASAVVRSLGVNAEHVTFLWQWDASTGDAFDELVANTVQIHNADQAVATFVATAGNGDYRARLLVSDECNPLTKELVVPVRCSGSTTFGGAVFSHIDAGLAGVSSMVVDLEQFAIPQRESSYFCDAEYKWEMVSYEADFDSSEVPTAAPTPQPTANPTAVPTTTEDPAVTTDPANTETSGTDVTATGQPTDTADPNVPTPNPTNPDGEPGEVPNTEAPRGSAPTTKSVSAVTALVTIIVGLFSVA